MKLSKQDAELYWGLMTELQIFVNQEMKVVPGVKSREAYDDIPSEEKLKVRKALYDNPRLIEAFVKKNPKNLPEDNLAIVAGWSRFVQGSFFIERFLKEHAIFILNDKVYAVHGLLTRLDELIAPGQLPHYARTVLLPFKGKIIYDGILFGHNISFGGGTKRRLKETYLIAKQNGLIIHSLDPEGVESKKKTPARPVKDWRAPIDELMKKAKQLKADSNQPPVQSPAFKLIQSSIELGQAAAENPDDIVMLWQHYKKVVRAANKVYSVLDRAGK